MTPLRVSARLHRQLLHQEQQEQQEEQQEQQEQQQETQERVEDALQVSLMSLLLPSRCCGAPHLLLLVL